MLLIWKSWKAVQLYSRDTVSMLKRHKSRLVLAESVYVTGNIHGINQCDGGGIQPF